eukprot:scaffold181048_cov20-Cyclotella_meneghiniana.AAC.2
MDKSQHFLDYMATQEPAVLTYRKSDMILAVHSDVGYLNEEDARSRAGGHHFLSENVPLSPNNGAIHNVAELSKQSCHQQQKQRRGDYILMHAKQSRNEIYWRRWGTSSHPPPFKQTTRQLKA